MDEHKELQPVTESVADAISAPAASVTAPEPEIVPQTPTAVEPQAQVAPAPAPEAVQEEEDDAEESMSFEAMLDEQENRSKKLKNGMRVKAKILSIGEENTFVDIGAKIDGFIDTKDLMDDEGKVRVKVGETVELYIVSSKEDEIKLSHGMSGNAGSWALRDAFESGIPVSGRVLDTVKGGFSVMVSGKRSFCPISQIDTRFVAGDGKEYVGQTLQFKITRFEGGGRNVVLSRVPLLKELEQANLDKLKAQVTENNTMTGKVSRVEPYGIFVELLPGVDGMVHVSELSWSRVDNPADYYKTGDNVTVKVLEIGEHSKDKGRNRGPRISLSVKQTRPEPWACMPASIHPGAVMKGKVTKHMPFGCFVEIHEGVEGLVHLSELSWERSAKLSDVAPEGSEIEVAILEINNDSKKISLSIKQAGNDPWTTVSEKFPVGSDVTGTLEKKEKFGYFVQLVPGITGLLPRSKMEIATNKDELEKVDVGGTLSLKVGEIDVANRKITLTPEVDPQEDWKRVSEQFDEEQQGETDLGVLGRALMEKLGKDGLKNLQ